MSLPHFTRPQPVADYALDSASPVEIDTDWYWTTVAMSQLDQRIALIAKQLRASTYLSNAEVARRESERAGLNEEWEALFFHRNKLDEAYAKRRWNRAWLVTSSDGHIHAGQYCQTFQPRTTCTLLPQVSGWTPEEIVLAAGEKACAVCYPDAPVKFKLPCTLIDPLTEQEQAAKAAEKAAKTSAAQAKAITTPTGDPLYAAPNFDRQGLNGDLIKTEIAASRRALEELKALAWYGTAHPDASNSIVTVCRMVLALAAKRGTSAHDELEALIDKAEKSVKRDGGVSLLKADAIRVLL